MTSSTAATTTTNGDGRSPTTSGCSRRSASKGFQSGLSWLTILRKRENFREAFDGFDFERVADFTEKDVERLLANAGIIRHRGKIVSTINNAKRAHELVDEAGSLAAWFWKFEPKSHERPKLVDRAAVMAMPKTATSTLISKELKKRGWSFVGPTTVYAFMQAMGMVNDHIEGCVCRPVVERNGRRRGAGFKRRLVEMSGRAEGRRRAPTCERLPFLVSPLVAVAEVPDEVVAVDGQA